jgi:hypothetical protein
MRWILVVLCIASAPAFAEPRRVAGFREVLFDQGAVIFAGHRLDGPFYLDDEGNLFNELGFEVTKFAPTFGGYEIHYDGKGELKHYPETGVTVRRGIGFADVGVKNGFIYLHGRRVGTTSGFYLHKGHIHDASGRKVTSVERTSGGHLHYKYR